MNLSVVVVGHCASGKSSVVRALRDRGIDAEAVAQEHSAVGDLWNHHNPDTVVFLDVTLEQVRARRGNPDWPEWIFRLQTERLSDAREHADLIVDTTMGDLDAVTREVVDFLAAGRRR